MAKIKKETWKTLITEFVSVVFAVLLALALNHCREDWNNEKLANEALEKIILEVQSNIATLEGEYEDYQVQIDTLKSVRKRIIDGTEQFWKFGYSHPILTNSAWNTAKNIGALKDMDRALIQELSEFYIFQDIYAQNGFKYFETVSSIEYHKEENKLAIIDANITQLSISLRWAEQLSNSYKEFLMENKSLITETIPEIDWVDYTIVD